MNDRKKIGIVVGDTRYLQCASLFEPLKEFFDLKLFTFENIELINAHSLGIPAVIFNEDPKMPGYMKDLEEKLSTMDAIVAIEASRLSSFQALRASRRFNIPIGIVTSEYRPFFYQKYKNIRAIQSDIYNKSTKYWTLSHAAEALLKLEGVAEEYIRHVGPKIRYVPVNKVHIQKREKFRKYIGLQADHKIILLKADLEKCYDIPLVIQAFHNLRMMKSDEGKAKLLICGQGKLATELKYKSYDLGLGKDVIFIQQEIQPFKQDLLCASDICIALQANQPEIHEEYSFWLAEAMNFGVIPLIESGAPELECVSSCQNFLERFTFRSQSAESLTALFLRYLSPTHEFESARNDIIQAARSFLMDQKHSSCLLEDFEQMFVEPRLSPELENMNKIISTIESNYNNQKFSDIICDIEEIIITKSKIKSQHIVTLMGLKGDAHFHNQQFVEAESSYLEGLAIDPSDTKCLRGLGNVLWHSHSNEQALGYFKKALQKNPEDSLALFGIGMIYNRLGLNEDAVYWLQKAAESQPVPPGSFLALAQTCASLDQKGLRILQSVVDTVDEHPVLLQTLGQMYLAHGQVELGNKYIEMAQSSRGNYGPKTIS